MSCIVYQTDKKTGVKYAYESVSYWDKDKRQPRSKRKYIGKVDPETGEIITKSDRKKHSAENGSDVLKGQLDKLHAQLDEKENVIRALKEELAAKDKQYKAAIKALTKARAIIDVELYDNRCLFTDRLRTMPCALFL